MEQMLIKVGITLQAGLSGLPRAPQRQARTRLGAQSHSAVGVALAQHVARPGSIPGTTPERDPFPQRPVEMPGPLLMAFGVSGVLWRLEREGHGSGG